MHRTALDLFNFDLGMMASCELDCKLLVEVVDLIRVIVGVLCNLRTEAFRRGGDFTVAFDLVEDTEDVIS